MTTAEIIATVILGIVSAIVGLVLLVASEHSDLGASMLTGGLLGALSYVAGSSRGYRRGRRG